MELSIKEDLFFILSANMDEDKALEETERIANNFKSVYKENVDTPIKGDDIYRYYIDNNLGGYHQERESGIDKYVDNTWKRFMRFNGVYNLSSAIDCEKVVERLIAGGNSVIKY